MTSAAQALQAATVAALTGAPALAELTGVFDGPPARAAFPYAAIGPAIVGDWGHKTGRGREIRLTVSLWDDGGSPARLHGLVAAADDAIAGLPHDLGGHALVSLAFLRSRILRDPAGPWAGIVEYRARTLESD